jgi:MerC mercury resistance protein
MNLQRLSSSLDRIGSAGALVAAIAAPCCFPLFAAVGTAAGLSALGRYEGVILLIFQGFALLTLAGLAFSFRRNRKFGPLIIGVVSCAALASHFYRTFSLALLYGGLFGLIAATVWNYLSTSRTKRPLLQSTITCPKCGHQSEETMPTNACLFFYDCPGCHVRLKPLEGDCCVFCSYGSVPCPPMQTGESCCA